jgi:hypothetical protein
MVLAGDGWIVHGLGLKNPGIFSFCDVPPMACRWSSGGRYSISAVLVAIAIYGFSAVVSAVPLADRPCYINAIGSRPKKYFTIQK